jgi:hypothetical protein
MIRVYFDRNTFQDLYEQRNGVSASDVSRLRSAIRHGEVDVAISMTVLEETFATWGTNQRRALAEVDFTLDLVGQRRKLNRARVIKEAGDLLTDDIRAYAADEPPPGPYVIHDLSDLLIPPISRYGAIDEFVREHRRQKGAFHEFNERQRRGLMTDATGRLRIEFAPGQRRDFATYWNEHAVAFATGLAERSGKLSEVQARGVDGLLEIRSVRMAVGVNLSLVYGQIVEGRAPDSGDSRDVHHAICSTVAKVLVTGDSRLTTCLQRIPDLPLEVIDLQTLLVRHGRRYKGSQSTSQLAT